MNVLSLFSGIGGLDLGLEAHGCTTVAYSEIAPYPSRVMAARFPDAIQVGDITDLTYETNENGTTYVERASDGEGFWLPPIDIVCGGFPCQDISAAWMGPGIAGRRSGLWRHYAEAIRGLRPRGVLVENVANLTRRGLDVVLGDLAHLGYDAEWGVLRGTDVGAHHERARLFILAYPDVSGRGQQWWTGTAAAQQLSAERYGQVLADRKAAGPGLEARRRHPAAPAAWEAESGVARTTDGVPDRVDRVRCLGNAVIPQVAEHAAGVLIDRMERVA